MKPLMITVAAGAALLLAACASVPPEAVTAQEKISAGIETARRNQVVLIDRFADDTKASLRLKYKQAVPKVLQDKLGTRSFFTPAEVQALLADYGDDLERDLKKIDDQHARLLRETDRFFDDLGSLSTLNQQMLSSTVQVNRSYKAVFDQLKHEVEPKITDILAK